jgi:hypothetical protein
MAGREWLRTVGLSGIVRFGTWRALVWSCGLCIVHRGGSEHGIMDGVMDGSCMAMAMTGMPPVAKCMEGGIFRS